MEDKVTQATIRTSEGYESITIDKITESMDIVKIGNKHMKPYVYVREFDFTYLSIEDSKIYGIDQKIYKYVGISSEEYFSARTSKWVNRNINQDNRIGKILKNIDSMLNDNIEPRDLNDYINQNSRILTYCDTIEQAQAIEKSLIGIVQLEEEKWGLDVICLNTKDKPIKVNEEGYELRL